MTDNIHPRREDFPPAEATRGMTPAEAGIFEVAFRLGFQASGLKREGRWPPATGATVADQPFHAYRMGDMSKGEKYNLEIGLFIGFFVGVAAAAVVLVIIGLLL